MASEVWISGKPYKHNELSKAEKEWQKKDHALADRETKAITVIEKKLEEETKKIQDIANRQIKEITGKMDKEHAKIDSEFHAKADAVIKKYKLKPLVMKDEKPAKKKK